jgi:alpha-D-ribose 1-methylphosphonate 5-triphosphate diphosphatase
MQRNTEILYRDAHIVTRTNILQGSVFAENGVIKEIGDIDAESSEIIDCRGDLLIPGLIELHTDNLEMNIQPRPGVIWPSMTAAAVAHDLQVAGAGITTVFDAIALGDVRENGLRGKIVADSIEAISTIKESGLFRADHQIHMRCEISSQDMEEMLMIHGCSDHVGLLSIMDHTPGQRQWSNLEDWRNFHREKKWTDEEAQAILDELREKQNRYADKHRRVAVEFARQHNLPLASHDDTTVADCEQAFNDGVCIAEFPTTQTAAQAAKERSLAVIMGAPNAVRGQSHSGNIRTLEVAERGLLDGLSSDYVPASLLQAAFVIHHRLSIPLPDTVAMVSANIANLVHMDDRGEIAVGKRADLVRVSICDNVPVVKQVYRSGVRIV